MQLEQYHSKNDMRFLKFRICDVTINRVRDAFILFI